MRKVKAAKTVASVRSTLNDAAGPGRSVRASGRLGPGARAGRRAQRAPGAGAVQTARDRVAPTIADARDRVGPVLSDARVRVTPVADPTPAYRVSAGPRRTPGSGWRARSRIGSSPRCTTPASGWPRCCTRPGCGPRRLPGTSGAGSPIGPNPPLTRPCAGAVTRWRPCKRRRGRPREAPARTLAARTTHSRLAIGGISYGVWKAVGGRAEDPWKSAARRLHLDTSDSATKAAAAAADTVDAVEGQARCRRRSRAPRRRCRTRWATARRRGVGRGVGQGRRRWPMRSPTQPPAWSPMHAECRCRRGCRRPGLRTRRPTTVSDAAEHRQLTAAGPGVGRGS